ncbi:phosphoenolpyruvate--protein phosphotransferase [Carboxydothermus ferrireducens]|uniref:Phosphoenolpyruvate-protein phosphotransferase n=1 Tax=Carboxydothermus ferrireducens DSM 11255 TaxID=1119529 RepID=A0ABX2R8D9_9THEO|nr:phosphoenolpyruvate--protein phosphotransferase [Carboxydothermus ferrireducens]NYE56411.1 phosphotransferase system enzyme I (PtsI) [Carboxydothermus ferrireducens DSM 11255]
MGEKRVTGLGISEGIALGKVLIYKSFAAQKTRKFITELEIKAERERLKAAKERVVSELEELIAKTEKTLGTEKVGILKGQKSFLDDPAFYPEIEKLILERNYSAEAAVQEVVEKFAEIFAGMDSDYMRERAQDIRDVGRRLLVQLTGEKPFQLTEINEEIILAAEDLTPSETVQLNKKFVLGIIGKIGGKTSHTAILARSLGIPAVLGLGEGFLELKDGDYIILDGSNGLVIINPEEKTLEEYREKVAIEQERNQSLKEIIILPAITRDGKRVEVAANIGTPEEADLALNQGAESIGLYRTEFLFMSKKEMPSEEEQFKAYRQVAEVMGDKPVIIRTLDIGGDKDLPYLNLPQERNPFLGYRAIRIGLEQKELLKIQLRAILRASAYGNLKVMLPMISSLEEFRKVKMIFEEIKDELKALNISFNHKIELGIMIEVPSAALLAPAFAQEVDFFSIGTNDLVQYCLAVDRMNEKVAFLYDHFHPAVLRLIKMVADAAKAAEKWVGMCGGMAGDPLATPLLVGLGLKELSMEAGKIGKIKQIIRKLDARDCQKLAEEVLKLPTTQEVREKLLEYSKANIA